MRFLMIFRASGRGEQCRTVDVAGTRPASVSFSMLAYPTTWTSTYRSTRHMRKIQHIDWKLSCFYVVFKNHGVSKQAYHCASCAHNIQGECTQKETYSKLWLEQLHQSNVETYTLQGCVAVIGRECPPHTLISLQVSVSAPMSIV